MDHRLIQAVEKGLGWDGPSSLGTGFARGSVDDQWLTSRLLTPSRLLDLVMRRSLSAPQLRCFKDGSELHPGRYFADEVGRRGQAIRMVDMPRLGGLLREGCTLVLDEMEFFDATLEVACRALQWWSRELVQANAYLTTQDSSGFAMHWDDHDVVVCQLAGEKTWEVRDASRPFPMYRDAVPNNEPSSEIVWSGLMKPGDVMHIPRGYWHQATRSGLGGGFSLHVTFGFVKRTGVNWLAWLADQSRAQEAFRRDLDRWDGTERENALAVAVSELAATRKPAEFMADREAQRPAARHVPVVSELWQPTGVVCVTEFRPFIAERGDVIDVLAAGKRLTFAARALDALRLLLSGIPVSIASVAEITGVDAGRLAAVLTEEGLCAELTPELSSGYIGLVASGASSKAP